MNAQRILRIAALLLVAAALVSTGLISAVSSPAAAYRHGTLGQALALRALLNPLVGKASQARPFVAPGAQRNGPDGRFLFSKDNLRLKAAAVPGATAATEIPTGAVQTFDVFAPPPSFQPVVGFTSGGAPITVPSLRPTNIEPVWTQDEGFLVFSSNRDATGNIAADGHYHLWAISVNGGQAFQITSGSGNEYFPALVASNNSLGLVFTSDAQSTGVQNLFAVPFNINNILAGQTFNVATLTSPTLRAGTGFDRVQRPTISPTNSDEVVFSAHDSRPLGTGVNGGGGHYHLYFLFLSTGGFNETNNTSLPAKLTDGPADDTDPAFSPDGQYIAFALTANGLSGPTGLPFSANPDTSQTLTMTAAGTTFSSPRSIFLLGGGNGTDAFGTVPASLQVAAGQPNGGRITVAGTDDFGPAWSLNLANEFLNPSNLFEYLAFARGASQGGKHDIYYLQTITGLGQGTGQAITPETATGGTNTVVQLNTDDNAGQTGAGGNAFDDIYPTWSPFRSIFSIAYSSDRSVTYFDAAGNPIETARSIARGQEDVDNGYVGLLESEVLNLNPPNLLRYSQTQVVRIQDSSKQDTRTGIQPGQAVTFTVRLSDREAGIDNTNGPGSNTAHTTSNNPRVFLQIKDPDSAYQDAQGFEHKVFAKDANFNGQANNTETTSGTANTLLSAQHLQPVPITNGILGTSASYNVVNNPRPRGAVGGFFPTLGAIAVGRAGGGTNPRSFTDLTVTPNVTTPLPGTNPGLFIPSGPEYECQFLNAQFGQGGTVLDASQTDYGPPYYLAGFDDATPFSASSHAPRTEWLQLVKSSNQDNQGGVLYTATWTTPTSASDFYLDVIAYDNAQFPAVPAATSGFVGQAGNFRIYDNVWGFSTLQSVGNNDILVVSDYALGQKFAASSFGGQVTNQNLIPKLFGAESYYTDIDINLLPNSAYIYAPGDTNYNSSNPVVVPLRKIAEGGRIAAINTLGVASYFDASIDDGGRRSGLNYVGSQRYSIWRILSRGPLPATLLNSYLPQPVPQPAVQDLQSKDPRFNSQVTTPGSTTPAVPAATVQDAHRCVIWVSPYTGDLLSGPGSLDDPGSFNVPNTPDRPSTQTVLQNFVAAGGRLFISGQDVGSGLTVNGNVGNTPTGFLATTLGATLASSSGGGTTLTAANTRVTNNGYFDNTQPNYSLETNFDPIGGTNGFGGYGPPYQFPLSLARSDTSLDQHSSGRFQAQIDSLTPQNGAQSQMTYGGGDSAMVARTQPYNQAANTGGSRVVYAGFGFEGLSNDYYSPADYPFNPLPKGPGPGGTGAASPYPFSYAGIAAHNQPAHLMHNIVNFLRSGFVSGSVNQTAGSGAGAGQPVSGVTVYLIPNGVPPTRATFSATTNASGQFTMAGVEPGTYGLGFYKAGFQSGTSNTGFTVTGDATAQTAVTIAPLPPGTVTGKVTDNTAANNPVAGASVVLTLADGSFSTPPVTTLADGTYIINNVPAGTYTLAVATSPKDTTTGNPQYLSATHPEPPYYDPTTQRTTVVVAASQTTAGVNFLLAPILPVVSGVVFDSSTGTVTTGAGVPGAVVTFTPTAGTATPTSVTTDSTGHYTVALQPGTYNITVTAGGFITGTGATPALTLGNTYTQNFGLTPIPSGTLGGLVVDTAGNVLPGATVTLTLTSNNGKDANGNPLPPVVVQTSTPSTPPAGTTGDGQPVNYSTTLQVGTYAAAVSLAGFETRMVPVVITNKTFTRQNFTLRRSNGVLGGLVYDSTTNVPLGGALVTITDAAGNAVATTPTPLTSSATASTSPDPAQVPSINFSASLLSNAPNGAATTTNPYKITVTLPDYFPYVKTDVVVPDDNRFLGITVPLQSIYGNLIGTVHRNADTGPGLPGAQVTLTPVGGGTPIVVGTDGSGKYTAMRVLNGAYTVAATEANFVQTSPAPSPPFIVTIIGGKTLTQDFTLRSTLGTVSGQVTDATLTPTTPLAGVVITFTDANGNPVLTTPTTVTTDANGNYSATLQAGTYTATATLANYNALPQSVTVLDADRTVTQNFALVYQFGTLTGLVSSKTTGQPLAGATITLTNPTTGATVATLTSTGTAGANFTGQVPIGTYTVTVALANFATQTVPNVVVTPHGTTTLPPVVLVSSLGTVGGRVTDSATGASLTGATITLTNPTTNAVTTLTSGPDVTLADGKTGNYLSPSLPAGVYNVTVTLAGYNSVPPTGATTPQTVTIPNGDQFIRQDFVLVSTTGTFGGLVTDVVTGVPIAGATLTLSDPATGNLVATFPTKGTATTGPDGKPLNYSGPVLQGTYNLTVTRANFTSPLPVSITIAGGVFTRKDFQLRSTIGRLGGLVTTFAGTAPAGGITITATNTTTGSVTTFSTSALPTTPPAGPLGDGQPVNYSGSLPQGTYTVVASKSGYASVTQTVTVVGDAFVRLDFQGTNALPALHQFPQGLNFFSAPYDYSGLSWDTLLGPLNTAPKGTASNGNRSHVAVWNPQISQYVLDPTPPADALRLGIGYWVYLYHPANITQTGPLPTDATVAVTLHPFWNQIGVPSLTPINVSDLVFSGAGSGTRLTFAQATSTTYNLISPTLYRFDGVGYEPVGPGDTLQPYQAYWIKTYADATVFIPTRPVVTAPGSISGVVTDNGTTALPGGPPIGPGGTGPNPIPGATVTFVSAAGTTVTATTAADGTFSIANVPAGTYTGSAAKTGYKTSAAQTLLVTSGRNSAAAFVLVPGP